MYQQLRKRGDWIRQMAYHLDMEFQAVATDEVLPYLQDFHLFRQGRRKRIANCLRRTDGMLETDIRIFDYQYLVGSGKHLRQLSQTVFFVQSRKLGLPEFLMRPESFFFKIGEWLGLQRDIDFEAWPDFSKQYRLEGTDEDYIRASLREEVLHFFTLNRKWSLEGVNYYFIFYQHNHLLSAHELNQFYRDGLFLLEHLEAEPLGLK